MLSVGVCAQLACIWEATARKPGNVHRFCDFADMSYVDFLTSAAAIGPVMEGARLRRVGATVLEAIRATRLVTRANTNLGIVLLLAPLAAVAEGEDLRTGVARVLNDLGIDDARHVYEAIRLASPGGLGDAPEQDVRDEPTMGLREAMTLAAERDGVARQYANGFRDVFDTGLTSLRRGLERSGCLEGAIVHCHLSLMAALPDTLIARKRGQAEAREAALRAQTILDCEEFDDAALEQFDAWLRADGNARNPGTTADLVTATLFVALRTDVVGLPLTLHWGLPREGSTHPWS
jgi:triphosphoribosyl-dephospho-CoA synthase